MRSVVWSLVVLAGCGARTGVGEERAAVADAGHDARGSDAARVDGGSPCGRDSECSDGVDCTIDVCDRGRCRSAPVDTRCDDGVFCNGREACSATGCVRTPAECADAIACTRDSCDEVRDRCVTQPDDSLCPVSFRCDRADGCVARAIVHSDVEMFEVDLPSGRVTEARPTPAAFTDIALAMDGTLYATIDDTLVRVDPATMSFEPLVTTGLGFNALDAAPDGTLLGAYDGFLVRIDPRIRFVETIGRFPGVFASSGDLAVMGTAVYATGRTFSTSDALIRFDLPSGEGVVVGETGLFSVWGLAFRGDQLYGFTDFGQFAVIDRSSGRATVLGVLGRSVWGAAAR